MGLQVPQVNVCVPHPSPAVPHVDCPQASLRVSGVQHVLLAVQTCPPAQVPGRHATQVPPALQKLRPLPLAVHSALVVQALQVFPEQIGVAPVPQVALVKHPTQVFVAALQSGVVPVQARALVAVQAPQLPPLRQARAALPFRALHSASPAVGGLACVQPRQVKDAGSQMGVVAVEHWVLVKHPTQAPVAVRH
jgi:hypothetical protein